MTDGCACVWTDDETTLLLEYWSNCEIQERLQRSTRNFKVYQDISAKLLKNGIRRTALQCREKIKKLKDKYRKMQDAKPESLQKSWQFYDVISEVFLHNAGSESVALLNESSTQSPEEMDTQLGKPTQEHNIGQSTHADNESEQPCLPDTAEMIPDGTSQNDGDVDTSSDKRGLKRKRGRPAMANIILEKFLHMELKHREDILQMEERTRAKELEAEHKRIQEEHKHEERMFKLLIDAIQPHQYNLPTSLLSSFPSQYAVEVDTDVERPDGTCANVNS